MAPAFLQYLPQDNSLATNPDAEQVVSQISSQLGALLHKDDDAFWDAVEANQQLAACLDSYLCHIQYVYCCCWAATVVQQDTCPYFSPPAYAQASL